MIIATEMARQQPLCKQETHQPTDRPPTLYTHTHTASDTFSGHDGKGDHAKSVYYVSAFLHLSMQIYRRPRI